MKTSENINELSKSLSATQKEMRAASKDSNNPFFKSKYSDLSSVIDVIREPMGINGLSFVQDVILDEKGANISTRILHSSGQWIEFGPLTIPLKQKDAHGVGSAITYGKRYALCACLGIVSSEDQDDDGNKAVASYKNEPKKMSFTIKESPQSSVDHSAEKHDMVNNNTKTIDKSQWTELNQLIDKCSPPFQQKIWDRLASLGVQSMAELDEETFVKMRDACLGNIAKSQKVEHAVG